MIDAVGNGRLVDFDLARRQNEKGARQSMRTVSLYLPSLLYQPLMTISQGTWQFTSTAQLLTPGRAYEVSDELESLFFITLYEGVHWVIHNKPEKLNLKFFFDQVDPDMQTGGAGKQITYTVPGRADILRQLSFEKSPPFTNLIRELFVLFRSLAFINMKTENTSSRDAANVKKLGNCEEVVRLMEKAMQSPGWPVECDKALIDNYPRNEGIDEEDPVGRASLKVVVAGPSKRGREEGDDNTTQTKRSKAG